MAFANMSRTWYQLDQFYREFIYHLRASKQTTLLQSLQERVENLYTNNYLAQSQRQLAANSLMTARGGTLPRSSARINSLTAGWENFSETGSESLSSSPTALRYEIGEELARLIEEHDRYSALPRTDVDDGTQLYSAWHGCFAASRWHLSMDENGVASIEGQSVRRASRTAGKILADAVVGGGTAIRSADLLAMSRKESRAMSKNHQVIYVYHNQIDAIGDKRETEQTRLRSCRTKLGGTD